MCRDASNLLLYPWSDIEWWYCFTEEWNGVSMLKAHSREHPDVVITSDASGKWGCGAFCSQKWFHLQWSTLMNDVHITTKELTPTVLA